MNKNILAIDPGNEQSAYVLLDENLKPIDYKIIDNESLLEYLERGLIYQNDNAELYFAIEMVSCYGMPVGKEIFETCLWIGKFIHAIEMRYAYQVRLIYRKEEKINLCNSMKAKDGNIRQALIDRFGEVGIKKNQGWFYGVSKDIWSAVAIGVTYHDLYLSKDII